MAPIRIGGPLDLVLLGLALGLTWVVGTVFYNIFLHPLRNYPGPLLHRATPFPRVYYLLQGKLVFSIKDLQEKYGPVVRIAPNELAYVDVQAWKDIYGHRAHGQDEFQKSDAFYRIFKDVPPNVLTADRDSHAALRRQLAHGFSEQSMRAQEPIIGAYVNLLIQRLHEQCKGADATLNMRDWFNYTTFDVIGDLTFGAPFGCLGTSDYHPWIRIITESIRQHAVLQSIVALCGRTLPNILFRSGRIAARKNQNIVKEKLAERIELGHERPDFIEGLLRVKDKMGLSFEMLTTNSSLLIMAGSETTATLLSGAVFLLTTNTDKLEKLVREVRTSFNSDEEITLLSVGRLSYMLAVLNEALRQYPPVATGMPRIAPKGGATVVGKFVPEGTVVANWQWAVNHRSDYWTEPERFVPERWQNDPKYKGDQFDAMQPFSVGPRNCVGRNLAYAEMRLILAKIVYNFDLDLDESSRDWLRLQKAYAIWDKPALQIHLTPVKRD